MDPNATLKDIAEHTESGDEAEARSSALYLKEWICNGGFQPDWDRYPEATAWYHSRY